MIDFYVVIPARYESTRLPKKLMQPIAGRSMLQHVYERALKSGAKRVLIATDHSALYDLATSFHAEVFMTGTHHPNGSSRIAELLRQFNELDEEIIVGLQADEPMMPPQLIQQVARLLPEHPDVSVATLAEPIDDESDFRDPNVVKVVRDQHQHALYFSRAPIPFEHTEKPHQPLRHIGIYAYRAPFIQRYVAWPVAPIERSEKLEQLRILWQGERVIVGDAECKAGLGVDTEADLEKVRACMKG